MYFTNPTLEERYYVRLLLIHVKGLQSFNYLKIVDKKIHPIFKSACAPLRLLEDNREWQQYLEEALAIQSGFQLMALFVILLLHGNLVNLINL